MKRHLFLLAPAMIWLAALTGAAHAGDRDALEPVGWLAARLATPGLAVLDVRPGGAYAKGHVPGAVSLPLHGGAWLETRYEVANMLSAPAKLAGVLGAAGIGNTDTIAVIAGSGSLAALADGARAFWSLKALGHGEVVLIDGGYGDWRAHGLPQSTTPPVPRPPVAYLPHPDRSVIAGVMQVEDADDDNYPPVDARERTEFEGHVTSPLVSQGGTILDSVNLPPSKLIDPQSGRFEARQILRQRLAKVIASTRPTRRVIFSNTGLRAALVWFAMHELLGLSTTRLYDGSLAEWAKEDYDMYDSTDGMGGVIGG